MVKCAFRKCEKVQNIIQEVWYEHDYGAAALARQAPAFTKEEGTDQSHS
jgi:hypothetical protein